MASAHSESPIQSMHRSTDQSWSHGYGRPKTLRPKNARYTPHARASRYAGSPGTFKVSGLPVRVMRRRATLPHPVGCSTIAVPGLSFRVRNGTGRLSWAMAAANLGLSAGKQGVSRRRVAVRGPDNGRDSLLLTDRARVRTVLPVRLRGALPGPAPHTSRACGCGLPLDH